MSGSPGAVKNDITLPNDGLLSDEEFLRLITEYHGGNSEAKNTIVQHNLRLVMSIAQRFGNRGELEDLFQIGCIGLMKAVEKFNPTYGVKFSTYAVPVIIGEIKQHLRDEGPIKISRGIKEVAVKVEQTRVQLLNLLGKEPTLSELEEASGLPREEIAGALEATRPVNSLQDFIREDEGDVLYREQLVGEDGDHSKWLEHFALREVIEKLPPRLKSLIELRFFEEKTQTEVAGIFGVSQVQVCRLEKEALHQLRKLYLSD
ncbi:RNA polymerase sigma (RpoX/SigF) subunit [Hydrogenispora ethanolica]|uniref:RNA polymerase sigma factor n=1 Tax=Hydrogenispora ethanolica TaxID=1082276 RepID=A0A4R1RF65_HYDET|nr:SigB/SigF/SigG family RNA polymerase sigma factor [Hydrogenispora ethanolica]TCL64212.1 RNA polymerase sigma (RpoX/SigF) subunit [Hydrogenispora ethanolica]